MNKKLEAYGVQAIERPKIKATEEFNVLEEFEQNGSEIETVERENR